MRNLRPQKFNLNQTFMQINNCNDECSQNENAVDREKLLQLTQVLRTNGSFSQNSLTFDARVEKIIYMKYAEVENTKLIEWYLKVDIGNYNGLICARNELER